MSKLPMNWTLGQLSEAAHIVRGITFPAGEKRSDFAHGYVCCLRTTNVQQTLEWDDVYYVPKNYVKRDDQIVREGDVLMSMANSYELVGKVARADNVPQRAAFGAFLAAVRPTPAINGGYLYHFLRSSEAQSKLREGSSQTTNIANISAGRLSELPVPLAPLKEQKRIADKLDSVLTRVDAVNTSLGRVAPLLKRFRQSVLAAATSGQLTMDWRHHNQVGFDSWAQISVGEMAEVIDPHPSHRTPPEVPDGVPYVSIGDITVNGEICLENARRVSPTVLIEHNQRYRITRGDFIFGKIGTLGKPAKLPVDVDYTVSANVLLIQPNQRAVLPEYAFFLFSSPDFMQSVLEQSTATSQAAFGIKKMRGTLVKLPSLREQAEIVRRIETLSSFADRLEDRLRTAQIAAGRLTPSLLAKTFRGELVPQDPNDEPASELLKRLAASTPAMVTRKKRSTTTS